ncbi:MAG TPA: flagellar basal body L-ring protein FlgH [Acidobacteriaceae bacterium]|jgi:flagellar L-ring protein precursor FlgH|nr:flagellar basal body L-ring protein FlgH [Acidobacteriaceae bacterium]
MRAKRCLVAGLLAALVLLPEAGAGAAKPKKAKEGSTPPDVALRQYIDRVRAEKAAEVLTAGSIWTPTGRLTNLVSDVKAIREHDPIAVVVSESLAASTDGTVKNQRASTASSQISALLGKLKSGNALNNLLSQSSSSSLNAQGQSVTNSSISTTLEGDVEDVLPNGMLVIQVVRQLTFNQQTQLIRLRGLVRPEDVNAQNQVLSTAITDMELEVVGKGIVNDATYRQNPVVRFLEKILVF